MIKAIKIALLYWLRQALRVFCPHDSHVESQRCHKHVCPNCALSLRIHAVLSSLCGMDAIYRLRKCDLCSEPLSERESGVHLECAEMENARADAYQI